MPIKVKYQMRKESLTSFVAAVFALLGAVMLAVVFWPIFVQFLSGGTYEGAPLSGLTTLFYAVLIGCMLFFALFTALLAKKTLLPSALFSVPVFLFYFLDASGLRNTILFFDADNVFHYYRDFTPLFRGWWMVAAAVAVIVFVAGRSYFKIAINKARTKNFAFLVNSLNTLVWTIYGIILVVGVDLPQLKAGVDYTQRDFIYSILYYLGGTMFFVAVTILTAAVRKTLVGAGADIDQMVQRTTGYADAGHVQPPAESSYSVVPNPVQYAEEPAAAPVPTYHADPDEMAAGIDPHEQTAVVSAEQAEALVQENVKPDKKSRRKKGKEVPVHTDGPEQT